MSYNFWLSSTPFFKIDLQLIGLQIISKSIKIRKFINQIHLQKFIIYLITSIFPPSTHKYKKQINIMLPFQKKKFIFYAKHSGSALTGKGGLHKYPHLVKPL